MRLYKNLSEYENTNPWKYYFIDHCFVLINSHNDDIHKGLDKETVKEKFEEIIEM